MRDKEFSHVTSCHTCNKYWNTMSDAQARVIYDIHKNENYNHIGCVKNLLTGIVVIGMSRKVYDEKMKEMEKNRLDMMRMKNGNRE